MKKSSKCTPKKVVVVHEANAGLQNRRILKAVTKACPHISAVLALRICSELRQEFKEFFK